MRNNPRIASLFAGLAAAGVQVRCNWQARRDGKSISVINNRPPDVEHLAFVGDGFAPSISTAVLIDYDGDGYGLYLESPTASIDGDVAAISKPRQEADTSSPLQEFAEMVARLTANGDEYDPDGDYCPNGFEHDTGNSLDALDEIIHKAREITGIAPKGAEFDWNGPEEGDECDLSVWILSPYGEELLEVDAGVDVETNKEIARRMVAKINASADLRKRLTDELGLLAEIEKECAA